MPAFNAFLRHRVRPCTFYSPNCCRVVMLLQLCATCLVLVLPVAGFVSGMPKNVRDRSVVRRVTDLAVDGHEQQAVSTPKTSDYVLVGAGYCRQHQSNAILDWIQDAIADNHSGCEQQCHIKPGCTAFAFVPDDPNVKCNLYRQYHYQHAEGTAGATCYALKECSGNAAEDRCIVCSTGYVSATQGTGTCQACAHLTCTDATDSAHCNAISSGCNNLACGWSSSNTQCQAQRSSLLEESVQEEPITPIAPIQQAQSPK